MLNRIFGSFMLILVIGVVFYLYQNGTINNENNIKFIESHFYNNKLIDSQNEVGVKSSDDVKWYYDDSKYTICIQYGKVLLKYKVKDFIKHKNQEELNKILIKTEQNKETLELILYYNNKELKEYVKT